MAAKAQQQPDNQSTPDHSRGQSKLLRRGRTRSELSHLVRKKINCNRLLPSLLSTILASGCRSSSFFFGGGAPCIHLLSSKPCITAKSQNNNKTINGLAKELGPRKRIGQLKDHRSTPDHPIATWKERERGPAPSSFLFGNRLA